MVSGEWCIVYCVLCCIVHLSLASCGTALGMTDGFCDGSEDRGDFEK